MEKDIYQTNVPILVQIFSPFPARTTLGLVIIFTGQLLATLYTDFTITPDAIFLACSIFVVSYAQVEMIIKSWIIE
jgi:hypothetical protein